MLLPRRDGEAKGAAMLKKPYKPFYRTNNPGDMATVAMEHVNRCGEPWPGLSNPELDWAIAHSNGDDTDTIWAHYRALFQDRTEPLPADFLDFVADLNSFRPDYEARALAHPEWVWFWIRRVLLEIRRGQLRVARNNMDRVRSCYARFFGQFGQFRSFGRVSVPRWTAKHPHPTA